MLVPLLVGLSLSSLLVAQLPTKAGQFRPPAVPLVTHTPYFSVWSPADKLTDGWTKHWTGATQAMVGIVRIDGKPFRFMGQAPDGVPALEQLSVTVTATRSIYRFSEAGVELKVEFLSPLLADDLAVLTAPVTYINLIAHATDGQSHKLEAYMDWSGEWAVDKPGEAVNLHRLQVDGRSVGVISSKDQKALGRSGDDLRIDWGSLYVMPPTGSSSIAPSEGLRKDFAAGKGFPATDDSRFPRPAYDEWPVFATSCDFGSVGSSPVSRHWNIAYDEQYSIEYFHRPERPYWREMGGEPALMLQEAETNFRALDAKCAAFDASLNGKLVAAGGEKYAQLCELAYRQCLAGHGIVNDVDAGLLMFSKENFSNGCIGTVDVTFPGCPFFLYFNPKLLEAQLRPILDYAESPVWKFDFAPHDLGTYPLANGQVYGGGSRTAEDQMPVEECGNMLIMVTALTRAEKSTALAHRYFPTLEKWAHYLLAKGLDPDEQLCTDDFAGHLAHNANLSLKAILAVRGFGELCERLGKPQEANKYIETAKGWAKDWLTKAGEGNVTKLAFDKPGTWSQKYNLVWDDLLGYNLFSRELKEQELATYRSKMNAFGWPLDSRADYTKGDWCLWSATLAGSKSEFEAFLDSIYHYADATPSRVPLSDWHDTVTGKMVGFQARTVVGGLFIKLLKDSGKLAAR